MKDYRNIHEMLYETMSRNSDQAAYRWIMKDDQMVTVTWNEFYSKTKEVSKSLLALDIKKGDKVSILSNTCYRWVLSDLGITSMGATTVGIYQSNLPKDCQYIINHADAVVIFAEDIEQLQKLMEIRKDILQVRKVILFNGSIQANDWVMSYDDFIKLGQDVSDETLKQFQNNVAPDDTATIVYTSGTTGVPKGAVITHDNITFTAQSIDNCGDFIQGDEGFMFLPLAHVFARTCVYTAMLAGSAITFFRGMDTLIDDFKIVRPHWFASVPRIFEKVFAKINSNADTKGGLALKIFQWAREAGSKVSDLKLSQQPIPLVLDLQYKLATKLVFSKIQEALGGRVRWCISGAAPLNPEIAKFFHAAGILILEGIGMTENTSFTNVNRLDNYRFGWVGPTGPGIEQKLSEDGEVMFRGRNIMKEYYKMPVETAETLTEDGWQYTGDLGEIDDQGFLKITGRKKDLIITAGGKNVAPAPIEGVIATSKYISQVCVVGDQRKFLSALVTVDEDNICEYADNHSISYDNIDDLVTNEQIINLLESEVAEKNKNFASFETIKKIAIVSEFTIENGLLTPTMKLKKNLAIGKYQDRIDKMYPTD